ncbi:MAG: hypothetical protein PVF79_17105 [Desulfobacterales bacterium]
MVLHKKVCDECNQYFGDTIELYMGRDSFEGFARIKHGIKPKKALKNRRRIKSMILNGDNRGALVTECDVDANGQIKIEKIPQVGFYFIEKQDYVYFEIGQIPTKEYLLENGYDIKNEMIWIIGDEIEYGMLVSELKDKGIDLKEDFNPVRNFIRFDEGSDSNNFFLINQPPILHEDQFLTQYGAKVTRGNLIILSWAKNKLMSKVSLVNEFTYGVCLCSSFKGIWIPIKIGHHFDLDKNEVTKLISASKKLLI